MTASPMRAAGVLLGLLAALAAAAFLVQSAAATLTPPPTGDWTIDAPENAVITSGVTTVTGNITVRGTLTVSNATLVVTSPAPSVLPRLLVQGPGRFTLDNATLRAGATAPARFTLDSTAGAALTLRAALVQGLGNSTQGDLSLVGGHLLGSTLQVFDTVINASDGGLGLDQASQLTGRNLDITVEERALYINGFSSANVDDLSAYGNPAREFLVLVNGSTLRGGNAWLENSTNLLMLLSSTAALTKATFEHASRSAILLVGSVITLDGALIEPRGNGTFGIEAYGSNVTVSGQFHNYTYGIASLGSNVVVTDSAFQSSSKIPTSSFAALYAFDGSVSVSNSTMSGTYLLTNVLAFDENHTPVINQTTGLQEWWPVEVCAPYTFFLVRTQTTIADVVSDCYSTHLYAEDAALVVRNHYANNGSTAWLFFHGSVDGTNLTARNFTNAGGTSVAMSIYQTTGAIRGADAAGSNVGAEIVASSITLSEFVGGSPGLGIRVVSGAPTISNSTFTIHNETAIVVQDGSPTIANSSFWLTADRVETFGVRVTGGAPVVLGNAFHGTYLLTYGIRVDVGNARIEGNYFEHLERAAQMYPPRFILSGNTFTECSNGAEARDGSSGAITGNLFFNMTQLGAGNGVNVYFSASLISDNTFVNVNYGVKVFNTNATLGVAPRVSGNYFENVTFYAIEVLNVDLTVLLDNNTVRNATRGGIEAIFSNLTSAYNTVFDSEGYGYEVTGSNLTLFGGRIENVREGIHGVNTGVTISYTTFLLNQAGMTIQDAPVAIANSSFQFNGIAARFISNQTAYVNDSIFVGNVEAIMAFNTTEVHVRDSNFVGTLDYIVQNQQSSTGTIEFTKRGELNGGRFFLRGTLTSTADSLTLRSLKMLFASPMGSLPGVSIRGASQLTLFQVVATNSSVPFFFEIEDSTGNLSQVSIRAAWPSLARPGEGPYFGNSVFFVRDFAINESEENFTLDHSSLTAFNLSLKENKGAGVVMRASSISGLIITVLDNKACGFRASQGSAINATNLTVRGNAGGSLCFNASSADIFDGDLSSGSKDMYLDAGSVVYVVSTGIGKGYIVNDTSQLTIAWRLDIRVTYPNQALLPEVTVSVVDVKGLAVVVHPGLNGRVSAISALAERVVRSSGADVRTPYVVTASFENASASENVALTGNRLVQLDLADRVAPVVAILGPDEGAVFASGTVTLRFTAGDSGSGLSDLLYRFGAGAFNAVDPMLGSFEITRDLVDGDHTFVLRAIDFAGNMAEDSVNFTVDTRAPSITVVAPRFPANTTRAATMTVQVTVESDVVRVWIGGEEVNVTSGAALRAVALPEGDSTVLIEAQDRAGNRGNVTVYLFADRTPPALTLEYAGNVTAESFLVIKGHTEPGSQVTIGNTAVPLDNGSFELLVFLDEGKNNFDVHARDSLLNENVTKLTITRGTPQPSHVLDIVAELAGILLLALGAAMAVTLYRKKSSDGERALRRGGPP